MTGRSIDASAETAHRPAMARAAPKIPALADFRRIVVKVGSSLLVDAEASRVREAWLASLADSHRFAVLRVVSDGPGHELFSARVFAHGIRALRALRAAAPALATWADSLDGET